MELRDAGFGDLSLRIVPHTKRQIGGIIERKVGTRRTIVTLEPALLALVEFPKLRMLALARRINKSMVDHAVHLVNDALRTCGKNLRRAKISVFGVSAHPNSREIEGSLVKKLVDALKRKGAHVRVYDSMFSHKELVEMGHRAEMTLTKSVEKADCLVIAVGHNRFSRLNLRKIKFLMKKSAAIVDMGRVIDPDKAEEEGFLYRGVGRGAFSE